MNPVFLVAVFALFFLAGCVYSVDPRSLSSVPSGSSSGSGAGTVSGNSSSGSGNGSSSGTVALTLSEVAKHRTVSDCWMVINSTVYDVSSYTTHPGGDAFVPYCGTDATVAFDAKGGKGNAHSTNAVSLLQSFELGALNQTIPVPAFIPSNSTGSNGSTRNSGEEDFGFGEDD